MSNTGDIESGVSEEETFIEVDLSTDRSPRSSFESTEALKMGEIETERMKTSEMKPGKIYTMKLGKESSQKPTNEEWHAYVEKETKHLLSKCRRKSKITGIFSHLFAFVNDTQTLYLILFSVATFIISSIKTEHDVTDYVLIGLSGIAMAYESADFAFKFRKRSIYFKKASSQYKRIHRKLNKYLYTSDPDQLADYLSVAYHDFDRLNLNDHQTNFNKFNKSYTMLIDRKKQAKFS